MSFFAKEKRNRNLIILSIALILLGSFFANMFNTSFYSTKVSRISFDTDIGTLSGLLYMPKGAGSNNPRPTIITTHGYLNSAEMQDAGAIEMSRRGFIVLALDMYDHGHSINKTSYESSKAFFSFWPTSIYDAVQYMYEQDYVLKDADGNGIIAVAGHSMGGFSSTMAMVSDEKDFSDSGIRKIYTGLTMGSDYLWTSYLGVDAKTASQALGPRTVGKVAAHYDDFFFDPAAEKTGNTVIYKDYVTTEPGQTFLGNPANPESNTMYTLDNGGRRVIYTPMEIHPWNHVSATTTSHQVEFYTAAFSDYITAEQNADINPDNQIWFFKELFEFIALVGFFLLFVPLISIIQKQNFFAKAKTKVQPVINGPETGNEKGLFWFVLLFSALFPALFFPTLMDKAGTGMTILKVFSIIVMIFSVIGLINGYLKKGDKKLSEVVTAPILFLLVSLILLLLLVNAPSVFKQSSFFNEPTTNQILYWAIVVTSVISIAALFTYYLDKRADKVTLKQYGFALNWQPILSAFLSVLIAVVAGYVILFIIDAIFKTDFRFWVWAVKTFDGRHVVAAIKYIPFFFLYFFVTGITVNATTGFMKKWKGYLTAILEIVGGLILFLLLHYGILFITGTAIWPAQALSSILLFALIPTLIVATLYNKIFFKKTGNVYTAVFLNTLLMTMLTVANTTLYSGIK